MQSGHLKVSPRKYFHRESCRARANGAKRVKVGPFIIVQRIRAGAAAGAIDARLCIMSHSTMRVLDEAREDGTSDG